MNHRTTLTCAILGLLFGIAPAVRSADAEPRVVVARNAGEAATMLRQSSPDWPWQPVRAGSDLYSTDLLLSGLNATVDSLDKAVRLAVRGSLVDRGPFPVLETAFVLHQPKDVDMDVTLDRGRITLTNEKKEGPAKVRVRVRDKAAEFILKEPGSSFAVEIYGRWPTGVPFKKDAKPEEGPALSLVILALKGEITIKGPRKEGTLHAPPGLAMIITDNINDPAPDPLFLDKLPSWAAEKPVLDELKKLTELGGKFRNALMSRPLDEVTDDMLKSNDPLVRRMAVLLMGATDNLPHLGEALMNAKSPDVWDSAVLALRHWIGRGPGQDMKLYQGLIEKRGFKPVQAEAILSLLHSFTEEELNTPETFEMLLNYMDTDKVGLRGLAYWHLLRLVPQGKKFEYEPTAAKDKRDEALAKWRKFIPTGQLPPKPTIEDIERK